jgi:steroid delta-isomerase-like uncharacterized protein
MMTREEMTALLTRCRTALANRDTETLVDAHAEDCVIDSPTAGGVAKGREAVAKVYDAWFNAFPDLHVGAGDMLIDGNRAALELVLSGTHTGGFLGLPPTGKPFRVPLVWMVEAKNGQISHARPFYDFSGVLIQIGVLKVKSM